MFECPALNRTFKTLSVGSNEVPNKCVVVRLTCDMSRTPILSTMIMVKPSPGDSQRNGKSSMGPNGNVAGV